MQKRFQPRRGKYIIILCSLLFQFSFLGLKIGNLKLPNICRENKMIKIPAAILNSLDKNNKIFPTAEAVTPRAL